MDYQMDWNNMILVSTNPVYVECRTYTVPGQLVELSNYLICKTLDGKVIVIPKLELSDSR